MPRRKVKLEVKVKAMRECLRLVNVEDIMRKYGVSERSAYNWYQRVVAALPDVLADEKPGRKSEADDTASPPFSKLTAASLWAMRARGGSKGLGSN